MPEVHQRIKPFVHLKNNISAPASVASVLKDISKFLMVTALAAIGLNTSFSDMRRAGLKPMLHGFIISLLVVLVAIAVEYAIGVAPSGTLL